MPELPEVHTITTDLKKYALGAKIKNVSIKGDYSAIPDNETLERSAVGHVIKDVRRIAKNIVIQISSGSWLVIHLAMTGRLLLRKPEQQSDKWERVVFSLEKNGKVFELRFCDMRMFGKVRVLGDSELEAIQKKYGPEPTDESLKPQEFHQILLSKRTTIKNALLDQNLISGLGNVYATDALWMAQIHPETPTKQISLDMATKLLIASKEILQEGIQNRGISMSDYVDLFGKAGQQQNFFRVYRKEICTRCKGKIDFKQLNGRGTYFCSNCQFKGDLPTLFANNI